MSVLLWLGFTCSFLVLIFTVTIFQMGMTTARSPYWDVAITHMAVEEIDRRGLSTIPRTLDNQRALEQFLAHSPPLDHLSSTLRAAIQRDRFHLFAIQSITRGDEDDFLQLRGIQQTHLLQSIGRLQRAVSSIQHHRNAARMWMMQLYLERCSVALAGLRWFTPRYWATIRSIGETFLATATLIGVWVGFLVWGFSNMGKPGHYADWISTVGLVITVSTSIGLIAMFATQTYRMLATLAGPITQWSRQQITVVVIAAIALLGISTLFYSGQFHVMQNHLFYRLLIVSTSIQSSHFFISFGLPTVVTVYALYRAIRILQTDFIHYVDRIKESISAFIFAVLFSLPLMQLIEQHFVTEYVLVFIAIGLLLILLTLRMVLGIFSFAR